MVCSQFPHFKPGLRDLRRSLSHYHITECFVRKYKPEGLSSLKSTDVVKVTVTVLTISLYHYEPGLWLHMRGPFIRCIEHCMLNTNTMVVLKVYQINTFWIEVMNDQEPHIKSAIFTYLSLTASEGCW